MARDQGVGGEQLLDGAAERARALAVNHSYGGKAREERVVEVLLEEIARLFGGAADQAQLVGDYAIGFRYLTLPAPRSGRGEERGERAG